MGIQVNKNGTVVMINHVAANKNGVIDEVNHLTANKNGTLVTPHLNFSDLANVFIEFNYWDYVAGWPQTPSKFTINGSRKAEIYSSNASLRAGYTIKLYDRYGQLINTRLPHGYKFKITTYYYQDGGGWDNVSGARCMRDDINLSGSYPISKTNTSYSPDLELFNWIEGSFTGGAKSGSYNRISIEFKEISLCNSSNNPVRDFTSQARIITKNYPGP